jgi:hypothetical protein
MKGWAADFVNDPYNDFEIIVEILYDEEDVAVMRKAEDGLVLQWYKSDKQLIVPVDWLMTLLIDVKNKLK